MSEKSERLDEIRQRSEVAKAAMLGSEPLHPVELAPLYHYGRDVPWLLSRIGELERELAGHRERSKA